MDAELVITFTQEHTYWHGLTNGNLISIAATALTGVIAVLALCNWKSSQKAHKQAHKPILKTDIRQPESKNPGYLSITNSGLGPALLQGINIYIYGKKIEGSLEESCEEAIRRISDGASAPLYITQSYGYQVGYPLNKDETIVLAEFNFTDDKNPKESAEEMKNQRLKIEVIYEDIFQKKSTSLDPQPGKEL